MIQCPLYTTLLQFALSHACLIPSCMFRLCSFIAFFMLPFYLLLGFCYLVPSTSNMCTLSVSLSSLALSLYPNPFIRLSPAFSTTFLVLPHISCALSVFTQSTLLIPHMVLRDFISNTLILFHTFSCKAHTSYPYILVGTNVTSNIPQLC